MQFRDLCSHVFYMSGDAWKEGGIDATGKLLISLILFTGEKKLLPLAMNALVLTSYLSK